MIEGRFKDEKDESRKAIKQADEERQADDQADEEVDKSRPAMLHEMRRPLQTQRRHMRQAQLHLKADLDLLLEKVDNFDVQ